jgi:hypothetical protein
MMTKRFGRVFLVAVAVGSFPLAAFADEIVHFTNGAEMTVRSHTVENAKDMVRLDLGGNSYIAFPMSMVDKIVSAGKDVFLNPVFHPSNQAIAGGSGAVADNGVHGTESGGFRRGPVVKGTAGVNLGEPTDAVPIPASGGQPVDNQVINSRRVFNPAMPVPAGSPPQVIMPPGAPRKPVQLAMNPNPPQPPQAAPPPPATPPNNDTQDNAPAGDPAPEDPPDTP